ncbi:pectinesterase inhibitor domain-containing protein, partial [Ralstonia pseudosolanacearum]|uniref:pectinesterase inhibitor domain-containing protein n=1 Tax=Ralstonia pseudosolanacearum TaxID=1310165 RepID=UPI003D1709CF
EIQKICGATDHPLICLTYVPAFLQGKFDQNSIIMAEISAIKNHTKVIVELANKFTADPITDDDVVEALDYCKENYDSALNNLDEAVKAVAAHDVGPLGSQLSAAAADISTCQDTFQEVTPIPSPLAAMDDIA